MDTSQRQPASGTEPADAVSLIRALVGVRSVRIDSDEHGVQAVHVTADRENADGLAARIRSALLAGLATPIVPGRIHVQGPETDDPAHPVPLDAVPHPVSSADPGPQPVAAATADAGAGAEREGAGPREPGRGRTGTPGTAPPYIVALDTERDGDRVVCRVTIAVHTRVHRAEAAAEDTEDPMEVAAEATVRALGEDGPTGLELDGLRRVTIGGRPHVIVSLRRPGTSTEIRFGSAPVVGSAERSAAEAVVTAASYRY